MNAFKNRYVFSMWFGALQMSDDRSNCLASILQNNGCPNVHITYKTLIKWMHPDFPIHGIFPYLSPVHQSDYMRCYFMHVYGGGYTDIKKTVADWQPFFDALDQSDAWGCGYTEVSPHGVAAVGGELELAMKANYQRLIGFCSMIFKPQTPFTQHWLDAIHAIFNSKYELAKENPARHPLDRTGIQFADGTISSYPFQWTEIGGNIFHPLVYAYQDRLLHFNEIAPSFIQYR